MRIDENARRHEENRRIGIERFSFNRAVGGIDNTLLADLKQHLATVVRIFLNHPGGRTRDPDIVVLIHAARMQPRIEKLRIAPGIDDITCRIEFNNRRSQFAAIQVAFDDILPIENEDMVLSINTDAAQSSEHPAVGQRLRPGNIGLISRRSRLRLDSGHKDGHGCD
ncbi:MAG: hypothetical protein DMG15_06870 [Acidobacteria bacterium]|nr:MAG: hypothetical protein DMG15_06870 [Acidobacteriota bacterium]